MQDWSVMRCSINSNILIRAVTKTRSGVVEWSFGSGVEWSCGVEWSHGLKWSCRVEWSGVEWSHGLEWSGVIEWSGVVQWSHENLIYC